MSKLDLLLEAERRGILPEDKKPLLEEARRRGLVPQAEAEIDGADRALRRGRHAATFGLADVPSDAIAAGLNVALGRDEGRGLSGEYRRQRGKTAAALKNEELNAPDVAADTAGNLVGAVVTAPLTASRTVGEMGLTGYEAGKNALMRMLTPRSEETLAANLAAKDMTRRQMMAEGARVGGGIGVVGGYTGSPDDATTGDILAHMAEGGAGGVVLGAALPPIFEAGASTINWGRNKLFRQSRAGADRANAAAADVAATGGEEFAPELGGPLTQGTSSGLAGTVFGGPIRAGARRTLDDLHAAVQREIEAAGGGGTQGEVGDRAQRFLRRQLTEDSVPEADIKAMNPLQLHDLSGVPPAPGVDVAAPKVRPVQPRQVRVSPEEVIDEAVANTPPVKPKPVTDLEQRYKPPTPEEVELAPEMAKKVQKADADVADLQRRLQAERDSHAANEKALIGEMAGLGYTEAVPSGSGGIHFHKPNNNGTTRIALTVDHNGKPTTAGVSAEEAAMAQRVFAHMRDHRPVATKSIAATEAKLQAAQREQDIVRREMDAFRQQELPRLAKQRRDEALAEATKQNQSEAAIATQRAQQAARDKAQADAVNESIRRTQAAQDAENARAAQATKDAQAAADAAHAEQMRAAQERIGEPVTIGANRGQTYKTEFNAAYEQNQRNHPQVRMNPLGARPPVYKAPPEPKRGARYTPEQVEDTVAAWEATKGAPAMPETLTQWIMRQGGVQDPAKEVSKIIGGTKGRPGLISKKGRTLDDIGEAAYQEGFFKERPTVAEVLDALDNDVRGINPKVRAQDEEGLMALREHQRAGVAGAKDADEVRKIMNSQLGPRPPKVRQQMVPLRPADVIHDTADVIDRFAQEAPMGRLKYKAGNLFEEGGEMNPEVLSYLRQHLGKRIADQLEHLSDLRGAPGQAFAPGIDKLFQLRSDIGREIRDIRASRKSGYPGTPRNENDAMLSRLYDALDTDIKNMARTSGPRGEVAVRQREQIDAAYNEYINKIRKPLSKIFGDNVDSAAAFQELVSATQNGSKKVDTLEAFYKVARDKGDPAQATAWLLNDMTRDGVEGFLRAYRNISPDARQLMEQAAPDLMKFLDAAARRGGRLERFIPTANEGAGIDIARAARPGNIAIGSIAYVFGLPGVLAEAAGGAAMAKVLASKWYAGWLKSYPVVRDPTDPNVIRHLNRFYAMAAQTTGMDEATAKQLKETLEPSKAKALFIGEDGANPEERRMLDNAKKMDAVGENPDDVWSDTGWMKGPDEKWRSELDDSGVELEPLALRAAKAARNGKDSVHLLKDVMGHSALFERYPEAKDLRVYFADKKNIPRMGLKGSYASYSAEQNTIYINSDRNNDPEELRNTVLHEVQHFLSRKGKRPYGDFRMPWGDRPGEIESIEAETRSRYPNDVRRDYLPDLTSTGAEREATFRRNKAEQERQSASWKTTVERAK